jgi:hypothetical protein
MECDFQVSVGHKWNYSSCLAISLVHLLWGKPAAMALEDLRSPVVSLCDEEIGTLANSQPRTEAFLQNHGTDLRYGPHSLSPAWKDVSLVDNYNLSSTGTTQPIFSLSPDLQKLWDYKRLWIKLFLGVICYVAHCQETIERSQGRELNSGPKFYKKLCHLQAV